MTRRCSSGSGEWATSESMHNVEDGKRFPILDFGFRNGVAGVSDIDGNAAMVAVSEWATSESMRSGDPRWHPAEAEAELQVQTGVPTVAEAKFGCTSSRRLRLRQSLAELR